MRIAIVNDMALAVEAMRRVLAADARHTVAWVARNGAEAVTKCAADTPDLVLMDLIMPVMDGVEAIRRIMASSPCAIVVVTATVEGNTTRVYEALGAGALDAVQTPGFEKGSGLLLVKLDLLEKRIKTTQATPTPAAFTKATPKGSTVGTPAYLSAAWLVGIGASAGGPAAVAKVLSGLPKNFPGAIVVVQHIDAAFSSGLITWWAGECALPVAAALPGTVLSPGHVYVAVGDQNLIIDSMGVLAQTDEPKGGIYMPSIDVFFNSMARNWRKGGTGVLLTGMGRDGARGLLDLRSAGFTTITQDQATSSVYGMPKAAAELNAATHVLPLESISAQLRQLGPDCPVAPIR